MLLMPSTATFDLAVSDSSFSPTSCAVAAASPGQFDKMPAMDPSLTLLLDHSSNLEPLHISPTAQDDIAWTINSEELDTIYRAQELTSLDCWDSSPTQSAGCHCLLSSLSFLEKLTSRPLTDEHRIDLLLSDVRVSIETLSKFVACASCATRVEQNLLLAMAARQLSVICATTANRYKAMRLGGLGETNSAQQPTECSGSADCPDISVWTYRPNQREGLHLLASLVSFHTAELQQQIDTIKSRYRNPPNAGQAEALMAAEEHVKLAQMTVNSHSP
jgi:hypothetical protein